MSVDFSKGKVVDTANPYDLALSGEGFFTLRNAAGTIFYTRNGQFSRDAEGRLVDARGAALQADGADLLLKGSRVEIQADGVVLEDGQPTARLDIVELADRTQARPADGGAFTAPADGVDAAVDPGLRQGAIETSNVSTAAEMVSMMAALRRAETGQRLAIVYDDLMGRVITTFGQTS